MTSLKTTMSIHIASSVLILDFPYPTSFTASDGGGKCTFSTYSGSAACVSKGHSATWPVCVHQGLQVIQYCCTSGNGRYRKCTCIARFWTACAWLLADCPGICWCCFLGWNGSQAGWVSAGGCACFAASLTLQWVCYTLIHSFEHTPTYTTSLCTPSVAHTQNTHTVWGVLWCVYTHSVANLNECVTLTL